MPPLKTRLDLESFPVGRVCPAVRLDQIEYRVKDSLGGSGGSRKRQAKRSATGGSYSGLGEESAAHGIGKCRRVCGWRAKHAISLGHWIRVLCGSG